MKEPVRSSDGYFIHTDEADLEMSFGTHPTYPPNGWWDVIDAECVVVCQCPSESYARMIVLALNDELKREASTDEDGPAL